MSEFFTVDMQLIAFCVKQSRFRVAMLALSVDDRGPMLFREQGDREAKGRK